MALGLFLLVSVVNEQNFGKFPHHHGEIMKIRYSIAVAVLAASVTAPSYVSADRPELTNFDQSFVYFKTMGKYPSLTSYNPATNTLKNALCATLDSESSKVRAIKSGTDFENLVVVRSTDKIFDGGIQFDKKFEGYRDAKLALAIQAALTVAGLIPAESSYKGTVLVDEVTQGLPMRWVLNNNDELKGILSYLEKSITEPLAKKPVLVLDILTGNLDEETAARLSNLFDVVDRNDAEASAFFNNARETLNGLPDGKLDYEGESFGEAILRELEGNYKLKAVNIAKAATVAVATGLTFVLVQKLVEDLAKDCLRDPIKNKIITKATAAKNKVVGLFA
jgi:hypothetical protein